MEEKHGVISEGARQDSPQCRGGREVRASPHTPVGLSAFEKCRQLVKRNLVMKGRIGVLENTRVMG